MANGAWSHLRPNTVRRRLPSSPNGAGLKSGVLQQFTKKPSMQGPVDSALANAARSATAPKRLINHPPAYRPHGRRPAIPRIHLGTDCSVADAARADPLRRVGCAWPMRARHDRLADVVALHFGMQLELPM